MLSLRMKFVLLATSAALRVIVRQFRHAPLIERARLRAKFYRYVGPAAEGTALATLLEGWSRGELELDSFSLDEFETMANELVERLKARILREVVH